MTGICFFYEDSDVDVWSGKDLDAWNYACKVAGDIDSMIVINKTTQILTTPNADMVFNVVSDLDAAKDLMSGDIVYMVCPWENTTVLSMAGFMHTNDWYVFGPASGWGSYTLPSGMTIPQAGTGAVHSVHAATVAMFHRFWTINS